MSLVTLVRDHKEGDAITLCHTHRFCENLGGGQLIASYGQHRDLLPGSPVVFFLGAT